MTNIVMYRSLVQGWINHLAESGVCDPLEVSREDVRRCFELDLSPEVAAHELAV